MDIGFILVATTKTGDAEAIGFDSLWIPEHPVIPSGPLARKPSAPASAQALDKIIGFVHKQLQPLQASPSGGGTLTIN